MGDSDEEYDRRRVRDKFKRERSDYQDRHAGNRREDWSEGRDSGSGWSGNTSGNRDRMSGRSANRDYSRDNYGGSQRRERYGSPGDRSDMSPPMKRVRNREWEERGNYNQSSNYDYNHPSNPWNPFDSSMQQTLHSGGSNTTHQSTGPTQPPMMTFKQFLGTQDDSVDDMDAVRKYNEYKTEFRRQQIAEFFSAHKDEEWFRSRYHPDEFGKRKDDQQKSLKNRLAVFMDLLEKGLVDSVSIDVEKSDQIIRLLDAAVIKLEGGNDFDLKSLDSETEAEKPKEPDLSLFSVDDEGPAKKDAESVESEEVKTSEDIKVKAENEESEEKLSEVDSKPEIKTEPEESDQMPPTEPKEEEKEDITHVKTEDSQLGEGEETGEIDDDTMETKPESPTSGEKGDSDNADQKMDANLSGIDESKPRSLHKKDSIFLRNIAPNITKAEIEAMCQKFPGFLRVALADPAPDRKFYRRGWVTFEKLGKIKEICWQMSTIKIKDCELGAIVNRDLTRRIRSVNGIASHKNVVRADIRHAAKIIFNLDKQRGLWEDEQNDEKAEPEEKTPRFGLESRNPLLKNIADYMIEEANAEEEELLGEGAGELDSEDGGTGQSLDRDENLIKVLDRLLLYLRVVDSVDYYNHSDYPNEDEMPNRIGIMHARGAPPSSKVSNQEVNEYIKTFETKIKPFLQQPIVITDEEANRLGKKNPEKEVEDFIKENTQEITKDKWLCPLSGKKFKGPDYVRKHIENKHMDRLLEVRKECEYFNNYVMDPKRPQLPEHPSNRPANAQQPHKNDSSSTNGSTSGMHPWPHPAGAFPGPPGYLAPYPRAPLPFANPMAAWTALSRGYGPIVPSVDYGRVGSNQRGRNYTGRLDSRDLVGYADLDDNLDMI